MHHKPFGGRAFTDPLAGLMVWGPREKRGRMECEKDAKRGRGDKGKYSEKKETK